MLLRGFLLGLFLIGLGSLCAQETPERTTDTLKIGVKETPPFVFRDESGTWQGISVELWERMAAELGQPYEYVPYDFEALLEALRKHQIHLSINPLTVTSQRIASIDFSQPFLITHLAVAVPIEHTNVLWSILQRIFSIRFLQAVLLLFVVILIFGALVWFFERKRNEDNFEQSWRGLGSGIWWSAVTMTTVGYGDKAPRTFAGRFVALIWMFTAIIIISSFTASIASSLTVDQLGSNIESLNDLRQVKVGTVAGTSTELYLQTQFVDAQAYTSIDAGLEALEQGELQVFVHDRPLIQYQLEKQDLKGEVQLLPFIFNTQYYSFAFSKNTPLVDVLNPMLLEQIQSVEWKAVLEKYHLNDE